MFTKVILSLKSKQQGLGGRNQNTEIQFNHHHGAKREIFQAVRMYTSLISDTRLHSERTLGMTGSNIYGGS